jgi:hypothetical protein
MEFLEVAVERALAINADLSDLVGKEAKLLFGRATQLKSTLRGRSLRAHTERVDTLISQVSELLPTAANDKVRAWKACLKNIKLIAEDENLSERIQTAISDLCDDNPSLLPASGPLLGRLIAVPAGPLDQMREGLAAADTAVEALLVHCDQTIAASPGIGGGLADIHKSGEALLAAAGAARTSLLKENGK